MTKLQWVDWNDSVFLRNVDTGRNAAWVTYYPDLGYTVCLWDEDEMEGVRIAIAPDLDTAKMIAKLNVEGELV